MDGSIPKALFCSILFICPHAEELMQEGERISNPETLLKYITKGSISELAIKFTIIHTMGKP